MFWAWTSVWTPFPERQCTFLRAKMFQNTLPGNAKIKVTFQGKYPYENARAESLKSVRNSDVADTDSVEVHTYSYIWIYYHVWNCFFWFIHYELCSVIFQFEPSHRQYLRRQYSRQSLGTRLCLKCFYYFKNIIYMICLIPVYSITVYLIPVYLSLDTIQTSIHP